MLAKDILKHARYSLSDPAGDRWSDDRLLFLLDAAIKELAKTTTLFVETTHITLVDNVADLDLHDVSTKFIRAEYLDVPIPFKSFDEMDDFDRNWQAKEGEKPEALVYDKQKNGLLKVYPRVRNQDTSNIVFNQPYGVVTDISYSDILPVMYNHYGDIAGIPSEGLLKLFYVRKHTKIISVDQELIIDDLCEKPIIHYIVGYALRDNQDTLNRELGNEEIQLYEAIKEDYSIEKEQNFVRAVHTTKYNGGIF